MENENKFTYTYSAAEAEEIKEIREKYAPKVQQKTTLEQIRELDRKAERPGTIASLCIGIIGTLLLGIGMSLVMVWGENLFILGVVVGIIGILIASAAYPAYLYVTKKQRDKIAPIILKLTEEISKK